MAGDFRKKNNESAEQVIRRARLPRDKEIIGILTERLGGNKMRIDCFDGKTRVCRVPGRLKRALWLRPGDVVIIEPWELDNEKGDVLYKYRDNEVAWLKREGYLEKDMDEF